MASNGIVIQPGKNPPELLKAGEIISSADTGYALGGDVYLLHASGSGPEIEALLGRCSCCDHPGRRYRECHLTCSSFPACD